MLKDNLLSSYRLRIRGEWVALALPVVIAMHGTFPVNEVAIEGTIRMQEMHGRVSTSVATLIGTLPVGGRVAVTQTCDGAFRGTVKYSPLVRLAARLKRVHLVTALDGQVAQPDSASCGARAETLRGRFWLADSVLTGHVVAGEAAVGITGVVRAVGDTAYHAEISAGSGAGPPMLSLNLYQR
jgi:hypothetical protein